MKLKPVVNPPIQNSQVANPSAPESKSVEQPKETEAVKTPTPAAVVAAPQANSATPQPEQNANASSQGVKAFKTLNFGDSADIVEKKLGEIVVGAKGRINSDNNMVTHSESIWRSLFDTDAEYEPYKYDATLTTQSDKLEHLMRYFSKEIGVDVRMQGNSAMIVTCYLLNPKNPHGNGGLAIIEVSYRKSDLDKLVEGFMQNCPNAKKENKSYKIESTKYPGVFLEFDRALITETNQDRRATLSVPTRKFTFSFTEPSKLSKDQLAVWGELTKQDGKTTQEYFESVKTKFLDFIKSAEAGETTDHYGNKLSGLTYEGWYDNVKYESIIYGGPSAFFASKQIIGFHMNNYRKSIEDAEQCPCLDLVDRSHVIV